MIEFYPCREVPKRELTEILHDEPEWQGRFEVVVVDFAGPEVRVNNVRNDGPELLESDSGAVAA